jgi:hypothetical protein
MTRADWLGAVAVFSALLVFYLLTAASLRFGW